MRGARLAVSAVFLLHGLASGTWVSRIPHVEQRLGRPIMSSLHGLWSLGNMAGAAVGAVLAGLGVPVGPHFLLAAPVLLAAVLLAGRRMSGADRATELGREAVPRVLREL